jgi:hypothetical protein
VKLLIDKRQKEHKIQVILGDHYEIHQDSYSFRRYLAMPCCIRIAKTSPLANPYGKAVDAKGNLSVANARRIPKDAGNSVLPKVDDHPYTLQKRASRRLTAISSKRTSGAPNVALPRHVAFESQLRTGRPLVNSPGSHQSGPSQSRLQVMQKRVS